LLANAAEAVLAAIFLDARDVCGNGLGAVQALAERFLVKPELEAMRAAVSDDGGRGALRDHKTLLQERVQASGLGKLKYVDTAQTGPAHLRQFTVEAQLDLDGAVRVLAEGDGGSKKEAQQRAAELALARWEQLTQVDEARAHEGAA
jgi:ribonuclease-3